jgi:hypothetical protein
MAKRWGQNGLDTWGPTLVSDLRQGQRKRIKRIYDRLIFDEINDDPDVFKNNVDIRQDLDVE